MTNILVTGANRGIGLEFARQYGEEGVRVFATCRDPAKAHELNEIAERSKGHVTVHALDVSNNELVSRLANELKDPPIDILINNAGVAGRWSSVSEPDYALWEETLRVNTIGPLRVTFAFRPHLMKSKVRKVIIISSGMGSTAESEGGSYAYRSSKAAVNNVMRTLSVDWRKDGFIFALLCPGWVKTDMGGPNARLEPRESIALMRKIIAGLQPADSGRYLNRHGKDIPW